MHLWHKFEAVGVEKMVMGPVTANTDSATVLATASEANQKLLEMGIGRTASVILYRCCCGAVKTSTVSGHWTLAQIRGEDTSSAK